MDSLANQPNQGFLRLAQLLLMHPEKGALHIHGIFQQRNQNAVLVLKEKKAWID